MGGFIGGVVRADKQLAPSDFQIIITSIQRRGAGTAFYKVLNPQDLGLGETSNAIVYLASAQEPGFTENGSIGGEPPILKPVTLIDGFPADRSISELKNEAASQRTVLPHGDPEFIARLSIDDGPFAFAALDSSNSRITLGRDVLGRKTIFYYESGREFWFSTDLPALLSIRNIPRRPNPTAVYEYMRHAYWNNVDQTMFSDVKQLKHGSIVQIDFSKSDIQKSEDSRVFSIPESISVDFDSAVASTRDRFLHSIAQVIPNNSSPIGMTLSGGTDSSSILGGLRDLAGPEREIHSFSFITPGHETINEERWIDIASQSANSISHKITVGSGDFAQDILTVTGEFGEPLHGPSQYLQFRLGQLLKEFNVRLSIDGVLGDSVTGGHDYLIFDRLRKAIQDREFGDATSLVRTVLSQVIEGQSRGYYVQALAQLPTTIHRLIRSILKLEVMPAWLNNEWFDSHRVSTRLPNAFTSNQPLQDHIIASILGSPAIRSAERNVAVNAADSRQPFLDTQFVGHMLSLPDAYLYANDGQARAVFKEAMKGFVPKPILNRTDKVGFNAPDNTWLAEQNEWANQLLKRGIERNAPYKLDSIPIDIAEQPRNRSDIIRSLCLAAWAERFEVTF